MNKVKDQTKWKEIYKFLLIKIQNEEWKEDQMLPSERSLAIKFNVSKNTINRILRKMIENGIIYSKASKGYFVSKNRGFFFQNTTKDSQKVKLEKSNETLQELDLKKINQHFNIDNKIKFFVYEKKYFFENDLHKKIIIFINQNLKNSDIFLENNNEFWPIYKWFSKNGHAIFKWIFLETHVEILEKDKVISNSGIKILINQENKVLGILKIVDFFSEHEVDKEEISNVFYKSLI